MSYRSDMEKVIKAAKEHGWGYSVTEKNHHQFYSPDKKHIVVAPGTPGDHRSWSEFRSQMKKAGFDVSALRPLELTATTSVGELLKAAQKAAIDQPPPAAAGAKLSARTIIIDYLTRHPAGAQAQDIFMVYRSLRPDMTEGAAKSALNQLELKGLVVRVSRGRYQLAAEFEKVKLVQHQGPAAAAALPPPTPTIIAPTAPHAAAAATIAAVAQGDGEAQDMEQEFDAVVTKLLDAFTTVEGFFNKYRGAMRQLAAIKRVMEGKQS